MAKSGINGQDVLKKMGDNQSGNLKKGNWISRSSEDCVLDWLLLWFTSSASLK